MDGRIIRMRAALGRNFGRKWAGKTVDGDIFWTYLKAFLRDWLVTVVADGEGLVTLGV